MIANRSHPDQLDGGMNMPKTSLPEHTQQPPGEAFSGKTLDLGLPGLPLSSTCTGQPSGPNQTNELTYYYNLIGQFSE